jgi:hypothetical protein
MHVLKPNKNIHTLIYIYIYIHNHCHPNISSQSGKTKAAYLTLSNDKFTIYVTTTKFKSGKVGNLTSIRRPLLRKVTSIGSHQGDDDIEERMIDIGSLDRVQEGQNTLRFELARYVVVYIYIYIFIYIFIYINACSCACIIYVCTSIKMYKKQVQDHTYKHNAHTHLFTFSVLIFVFHCLFCFMI